MNHDIDHIKFAIVDDNELVRQVIKVLLQQHHKPAFDLVFELESLTNLHAINPLEQYPDVILLDVDMPGINGIDGIPALLKCFPECAIIMLTDIADKEAIMRAIQAGAQGYIQKGANQQELVQVIKHVIEGGSYISPILARKLFNFIQAKNSQLDELTERERQVVDGITAGLSYKLIGYRYNMAIDTVRGHIKKIYKKLNINSKGELLALIKI